MSLIKFKLETTKTLINFPLNLPYLSSLGCLSFSLRNLKGAVLNASSSHLHVAGHLGASDFAWLTALRIHRLHVKSFAKKLFQLKNNISKVYGNEKDPRDHQTRSRSFKAKRSITEQSARSQLGYTKTTHYLDWCCFFVVVVFMWIQTGEDLL